MKFKLVWIMIPACCFHIIHFLVSTYQNSVLLKSLWATLNTVKNRGGLL